MYTYSRADAVIGTGDRRGSKISFTYCPHGPYKLEKPKKYICTVIDIKDCQPKTHTI